MNSVVSTWQRLARGVGETAVDATERCDFCSQPIPPQHPHLLEIESRQVMCACRPCAILFDRQEASLGKYRLIGQRRRWLADFSLSDGQWASLRLPVDMAFFFYNTPEARLVACYPSPMGPTESLLPLNTWAEMVAANPVLQTMAPDVEALLINRARQARDYCLAPIDDCYRLVALLRTHWRGFGGGERVWQEIGRFFTEIHG